ncbi:MAG: SDR family NAD(P)-dependent oxidoreductase [Candidatus Polarisedimenticolia bacterium]
MTVYAASNAALLLLGEGFAYELRGTGVEVMTVCPGGMDTNFQKTSGARRLTREKLMPPQVVAARILEGLRRHRATLLVSGRARSMALLARLLPRTVSLALWGRLMAALR